MVGAWVGVLGMFGIAAVGVPVAVVVALSQTYSKGAHSAGFARADHWYYVQPSAAMLSSWKTSAVANSAYFLQSYCVLYC